MWELARFSMRSISGHRLRSALSMVGIAIGIASVILLTSIGEGTRRYILEQFSQFGTNLIAINPGKAETIGVPGALGGSTRKLTIDDAEALARVPGVLAVAPVAFGSGRVEAAGRGRSVIIYGSTPNVPEVWQWGVRTGSFWPDTDPRRGAQLAVIGSKLKRELFGEANALGEFMKIGGSRYRVIGVMEPKGQMLGLDLDDAVWAPLASVMQIFNVDELNEIDLTFSHARDLDGLRERVRQTLIERHGGREDFTITSQDEMLKVFGNIMDIITGAVGAIAGVSLVVGAIGILTMMWIAVGERTNEIGLARAIGATRRQVQWLFLTEAAALALLGGLLGIGAGLGVCALLRTLIPGLPVETPMIFLVSAVAVSAVTGVLSGVLPARRAAGLDPVEALRAE
jgi:putative ABC transport system permease protein